MQLFLAESFENQQLSFGKDESHHIVKVLRKQAGDELYATDGKGNRFHARITSAQANACQAEILKQDFFEKGPGSCIAISLPKSKDRVHWLIEKCIEIGVSEIQPIISKRSERNRINLDRLNGIAQAAMKQSAQYYLPSVLDSMDLQEFLKNDKAVSKFIAYCPTGQELHLQDMEITKPACVLIGPEGDFTQEEVEQAEKHGFKPISLGPTRLRSETAAIVAGHILHLNWQKQANEKNPPSFT